MSDQIIATIVGSFMTLLGVLVTLRWAQISHERNLAHERQKMKDEREFAARQLAFGEAAEAIARLMQYLVTLPDKEMPAGGSVVEEMQALAVALTKLQCYAGNNTIEKATEFGKVASIAFATTMKEKLPGAFIDGEIKALEIQITNFENMNAAIREEIAAMLQNNPQNAQIVTHRNQLADNYRKIGALYGSKSTKIEEKWKTTQACRERLMHHLPPIQTAQIDLLISFRKEIGFEFDEARYATFMKSQAAEAMKFAGAFTKEINSSVAAKME